MNTFAVVECEKILELMGHTRGAVVPATPVQRSGRRPLARDFSPRYVLGFAALIGLYYGAAKLGYALDFAGPVAAVVWLPVGVAISFLFLAGLQFWPAVVVGDLLVNDYSALPLGSALGQTTGNLLEVVIAALLLRRIATRYELNGDLGGVWRMFLALALGTAVSATIGVLSLRAGGVITHEAAPKAWRTWWLGDLSGALLVVPLVIAWARTEEPPSRWHLLEVALNMAAVVLVSELAWRTTQPVSYIVFPVLIWAALRLGPRGATSAVFLASGFAVWATTQGVGPFSTHTFGHSVRDAQLFIAVASISTQCLAAIVLERQRVARGLWASRSRLVQTADSERRRLERNLHDGAQQRLAALIVRVDLLADSPDGGQPDGAALQALRSGLVEGLEELRQLAHGHHPSVVTEHGLAAGIASIAERSPLPIDVQAVPKRRLPESLEVTAYYVVAEAVANAQKYGQPSLIRILVQASGGYLRIEVEDNGSGGAVVTPGSGLEGLRDRVEAFGGTLQVDSPVGRGTRIAVRIPEHSQA